MLIGNGDLHLENLSIIDSGNIRRFTPVYDPTPMRAYYQHDMLSVMAFGDYGEILYGSSEPVSFNEAITRFAKHCGLTKPQRDETVHQLLAVTESYQSRVNELKTVPDENKERLISRVRDVRKKLAG